MSSTILIVDDDDDIRDTLRDILTDLGHQVLEAANGRAALDLLSAAEALPDLILLDLGMPVMNGLEFRQAQWEDARLAPIPIVLITAAGDPLDKRRAIRPDAMLAKPFRFEDLVAVLER